MTFDPQTRMKAGFVALMMLVLAVLNAQAADTPDARGTASFYSIHLHNQPTANGERYDHNGLTAAHRTLPFGTQVRVVNTANQQAVVLRINDRGPFVRDRLIDVSGAAAKALGMVESGTATVELYVLNAAASVAQAPQPAPQPKAQGTQTYTIQLASLQDRTAAEQMALRVSGAWTQPAEIDGQTWHRVYYGKYASVDAAKQAQQQHALKGYVRQVWMAQPTLTNTQPVVIPRTPPASQPVQAATAPQPTAEEARFVIQLGVFSEADMAQSLRQDVFGAWVQTDSEEGATIYRVYRGPFQSRGTAVQEVKRLKEQGHDAFIRALEAGQTAQPVYVAEQPTNIAEAHEATTWTVRKAAPQRRNARLGF